MLKREKGITLIALVVTIIVLLILAGISIAMLTGDSGILTNAKEAREENNKETATEIINLKIADTQMKIYSKEQRIPTLQELADDFCEDNEIEYVNIKKQETSEINEKITVGENTKIYTKLEEYPYEFEIGRDLKIANVTKSGTELIGKIPEGYIKPSGIKDIIKNGVYNVAEYEEVDVKVPTYEANSIKEITDTSNKIDVSNYQYVDTSKLFTSKGCEIKEVVFPTTGNSCTFDFGYIPNFIFIKSTLKNDTVVNHWSTDFLETIYAISTNSGETLHTSPAYSTNGTKITLTTSSSNWIGATMEIFAIK